MTYFHKNTIYYWPLVQFQWYSDFYSLYSLIICWVEIYITAEKVWIKLQLRPYWKLETPRLSKHSNDADEAPQTNDCKQKCWNPVEIHNLSFSHDIQVRESREGQANPKSSGWNSGNKGQTGSYSVAEPQRWVHFANANVRTCCVTTQD